MTSARTILSSGTSAALEAASARWLAHVAARPGLAALVLVALVLALDLAGNLLYQDDAYAPQAIELAQQTLDVLRAHGQTGWEAATLRWLGYAQWVAGRHDDALESFSQAYTMHERLGELGLTI